MRTQFPQFSAHVYCGQTVAHLSYCWALVQTVAQKVRSSSIHRYKRYFIFNFYIQLVQVHIQMLVFRIVLSLSLCGACCLVICVRQSSATCALKLLSCCLLTTALLVPSVRVLLHILCLLVNKTIMAANKVLKFGNSLKELRLHLCQKSPSSKGAR